MPEIASARFQADGRVRVAYVDQTESLVVNDTSTPQGRQLMGWVNAGNTIAPAMPPPITAYDVDKERDRRTALGQQLFLKSGKVISVATASPEDFRNVNYASDTALTLVAKLIPGLVAGDLPATLIPPPADRAQDDPMMRFRDYFRIERSVTYHEMTEISVRITDNINALNRAAHVLKDMAVIPTDYTDDSYWPLIPLPPSTPPPV